jgi:pimeloyl-ACP methyl ester carboxylesterase
MRILAPPDHSSVVVALHASASSSRQWRALEQRFQDVLRFSALDHIAHGNAHAWARGSQPGLSDHVQRLDRHIGLGLPAVHLVAHSFGAVVALQFALEHPSRVRSLALYEPVLLALLQGRSDLTDEERGVQRVADQIRQDVLCGLSMQAAQTFVGYWNGEQVWARLDSRQQDAMAAYMPAVVGHFDVIQSAHALARRLPEIRTPTLLLSGSCTTPSARRVGALISDALPHAFCVEIAGAGHMGPITHAADVNEQIVSFVLDKPIYSGSFARHFTKTKRDAANPVFSNPSQSTSS